jgi:hypothetical protein
MGRDDELQLTRGVQGRAKWGFSAPSAEGRYRLGSGGLLLQDKGTPVSECVAIMSPDAR